MDKDPDEIPIVDWLRKRGQPMAQLRARISALESQLAQYRWRRAEDEMPKAWASVLILCAESVVEGFVDHEGEWWLVRAGVKRAPSVTHWMPLPPAPGEDDIDTDPVGYMPPEEGP